jgi:pilus assembly protein Flp/PilA
MYSIYMSSQQWLMRLLRREHGATAVEYGLIVALIAAAMAIALRLLGHQIVTTFTTIGSYL